MGAMTQERSRALGRAIMAVAIVQLVLYLAAAARRSYLAVAIPLGIALGVVSALAFWVGYTMATTEWDHPADYPPAATGSGDESIAGALPPEPLG